VFKYPGTLEQILYFSLDKTAGKSYSNIDISLFCQK
jgi:hypothetical protein